MPQTMKRYVPTNFSQLKGLLGITDDVLEVHFKLYEGYVNRTNSLTERLATLAWERRASGTDPVYAEMTRRLGYEYNGMILHELYFENLKPGGRSAAPQGSLRAALEKNFGSYEAWLYDFMSVATMPGVGWAILFQNPDNRWLANYWIEQHHNGHPAGFKPILVMDAWEHAFVPAYKPTERSKYIEAFLSNINWEPVEKRLLH